MSKKTLTLILFLFFVTCGLLYLALVTPQYKNQPTAPTPTPLSVNAHTTLALTAINAPTSSFPTQYGLAVAINARNNVVNGVQLELAYDPQALTDVSIKPGSFFQQPNELINNVNTVDGRISYAISEQVNLPGKKGNGTLAYIYFNVNPTFTGKFTNITFLPKTAVAADKVLESVLRETLNYSLPIGTASAK